ncbi:MAG: YkvA family protein [Rhodoferax sp.]
MSPFTTAKDWARRIKRDAFAVYFAARDPRTPVYLRILALAIAAYALSPIDLIPDFIPVLGYLDDVLLLPLGIWLVVRLLPAPVLQASRAKAEQALQRPRSMVAAGLIVLLWVACVGFLTWWWLRQSAT